MTDRIPNLPPHLEGQSSWLSKVTSARILGHPVVWSGMTGLFILVGYLWLQYYARPLSDSIVQSHSDAELIGSKRSSSNTWNPNIYRPTETEEQMAITRQADILRAEKYRETIKLENKIQPLLDQARGFLETEIYTGNKQENAWQRYQSVLEIEPAHRLAKSGLAQILGLLQSNAEYATDELQYEEAEQWLAQLDTIELNAPFQVELRQRIAEQISLEVAILEAEQRQAERLQLLKDALQDAEEAMQMSPPKLRVAYDLYQRALEFEENNQTALQGLQSIHLVRITYAEQAITGQDYTEARTQIDRLHQTGAAENLIEKLELSLSKAQSEQHKQQTEPAQAKPLAAPKAIPETETEPATAPISTSPYTPIETSSPSQGIQTVEIEVSKKSKAPPLTTAPVTLNAPSAKTSISARSRQLSQGVNAYYAGEYNTAFSKLHPLAEANSPRAQFRLGIMYFQGRTVVKNKDLARQWIARALPAILRSAQKGQAWAQADLGTAYELGIGVKKNVSRAANLYQKAAKQGYAGAQTNLGVLYGTGEGVAYDRKAAIYWLKKAAIQGDKIAQDNLRILNAR